MLQKKTAHWLFVMLHGRDILILFQVIALQDKNEKNIYIYKNSALSQMRVVSVSMRKQWNIA